MITPEVSPLEEMWHSIHQIQLMTEITLMHIIQHFSFHLNVNLPELRNELFFICCPFAGYYHWPNGKYYSTTLYKNNKIQYKNI